MAMGEDCGMEAPAGKAVDEALGRCREEETSRVDQEQAIRVSTARTLAKLAMNAMRGATSSRSRSGASGLWSRVVTVPASRRSERSGCEPWRSVNSCETAVTGMLAELIVARERGFD